MNQLRALVTGGCGFVGRHFVNKLLDLDYHVTIVDNLSSGVSLEAWPVHLAIPPQKRQNVAFHLADVRSFCREISPAFDLIVHLAAVVGGRTTIEGDPLAVATDLAIDADMFNWVVGKVRPKKLIYFSSSAAYPISHQTPEFNCPLPENLISFRRTLGVPDLTYGWAKLTGEFLAGFAVEKYGVDVNIYRPFSGYGEDQDLSYPFPSIVRRIANRESPLVVWGSGRQLRDFIHIDDIVDAVLASKDRLSPGEALNLGSGIGTSFVELAAIACSVFGHSAKIANDSSKPEGVFARVGDCSRMFQFYVPKIKLEQGLERAFGAQMALTR
jgi:GDP-L-fucose synthase